MGTHEILKVSRLPTRLQFSAHRHSYAHQDQGPGHHLAKYPPAEFALDTQLGRRAQSVPFSFLVKAWVPGPKDPNPLPKPDTAQDTHLPTLPKQPSSN
ncbi:unnamed protein product [Prunus armeniaca]|uniref:Uncharacterized protein n=1 Tax=Prunus armeniaca TaxID=36596 RepID=A0A6J5VB34_PRUAR|nr:unnamed protein product [Prunus armeniaca]